MKSKEVIFILGFMGSGKSTIGRLLGDQINYDFVDQDEHIEAKDRRSIAEIFYQEGESYFRTVEARALLDVSDSSCKIISLGGGTPCYMNNMLMINKKGYSIFLHIDAEALSQRLYPEREKRPLISNVVNEDELHQFIKVKLEERNPYYMKADITINADLKPEEVVKLIKSEITG